MKERERKGERERQIEREREWEKERKWQRRIEKRERDIQGRERETDREERRAEKPLNEWCGYNDWSQDHRKWAIFNIKFDWVTLGSTLHNVYPLH